MSTTTDSGTGDLKSRLPDPLQYFPEMVEVNKSLAKATHNGSVDALTIALVQLRAGQVAGSTYHTVRQTELLRKAGASDEQVAALPSWRDAPYFSAAQRVALELVEAVLAPQPAGQRVGDELFARAAACYDDKALWTLTLVISQICFFVPVAAIAKPIPGRPVGRNYSA